MNDAPTGTATATLTPGTEDIAYNISAANLLTGFSDVDGDTLSVSGLSTSNGSIVANADGSYTITPSANFNGAVTLTYNVIDGNGGSVGGTQTFNLTPVNDAPTITSGTTASTPENVATTTAVYSVTATDPDAGTTLGYSLSGADATLFRISTAGAVTFKAPPNFEAPADNGGNNVYDIVVHVNDGTIDVTKAVAITVTNVNEAPVINSNGAGATAAITISENTTTVTTVAATDVDAGTSLTYTIDSGADASKFSINSTTGVLTFIAAPNFEAPTDVGGNNIYDVVVKVSDGSLSDTQAIAVTVTNANEAPTITSAATASTVENVTPATTVYSVTATDPDAGASFTYSLTGTDAALFNISAAGAVTFKAPPNFEAPADNGGNNVYDIVVHVNDGTIDVTKAVAITVTDALDDPNDNDGLVATPFTSGNDSPAGTLSSGTHYAGAGNDTMNGKTTGTAAGNAVTLYGGSGNDALNGSNGNDSLYGGLGTDTIVGDAGNDILVGGMGADILTGGAGSDTFRFLGSDNISNATKDTITDFTVGSIASGGDTLDISALLIGYNVGTSTPSDFIHVTTVGSGASAVTTISIDRDGTAGGAANFVDIAVLQTGLTVNLATLLANNEIIL